MATLIRAKPFTALQPRQRLRTGLVAVLHQQRPSCCSAASGSSPAGLSPQSTSTASTAQGLNTIQNMLVGGPALAAFGATALLLAPQRAWAEEAEAVAIAMGEDQSFSLPTTLEEWVTYILFVTVVGLLSVVTGGVAYINIANWLDSRMEMEEQQSMKKRLPPKGSILPSNSNSKASDGDVVVPLRKVLRPKRDKTKGFASDLEQTRK